MITNSDKKFQVLVTCPPMIKQVSTFDSLFSQCNMDYFCPTFSQTLSEEELIELVPKYDGWIIGDDPATREVFEAGIKGNLKAAVKWGVGVDNVDFAACKDLNIPITNVPNVFGEEVSDVAVGYVISLSRKLHLIDQETKNGGWIKPCGRSLTDKKVCLVGFGDIGRCIARKLLGFRMNLFVSDPGFEKVDGKIVCKYDPSIKISDELNKVNIASLEEAALDSDYIVVSCALNIHTRGLVNKSVTSTANKGVIIVNVARGPVVNEKDIIELLGTGHIDSVGFDVFEKEPLSKNNKLRDYPQNIFGSHNGSNTIEGVERTSIIAINNLYKYLTQ